MKLLGFGILCSLAAMIGGCGSEGPMASKDGTAEVTIALTSVPAMVACIKVQTTLNGAVQAPVLFTVTNGSSSATLNLGRLSTGPAIFVGSAYSQACTDATINTTAVPGWVSDSVMANLTIGAASTINLTFHQNNPVTVSANFVKSVKSLWAGVRSTYAVMSDGTVKASGATVAGIGTLIQPTDFPGATSVAEIAVSDNFSCLWTTAGAVQCWGILPGAPSSTPTPTAFALPGPALQIAAGSGHMCAIVQISTTNNPVYCWGANASGQLGNGTNTASNTPVQALLPSGDSSAYAIAAGVDVTCALTSGAQIACWGNNAVGQLGNGGTANSNRPVVIFLNGGFKSLTVGTETTCVLTVDGRAFCWGDLTGDGVDTTRLFPSQVSGLTDAIDIASGLGHTCAVKRTGGVVCWGGGIAGATAMPTGVGSFLPLPVNGIPLPAVEVETHQGLHTCAILQDGSAWCWGANETGQLGDGTITPRFVPTRMKVN
jgi:alpha-tubulin suppressor-like RCC1 family protein